jgi:membrane fusion protein, multidrug efflux system
MAWTRAWGGLVAAVLVVLGAWPAVAQAPAGDAPPQVDVVKPVVKEIVEHDDYTGRFNAVDFVEVRARVNGYLDKINFEDGATVKRDQVLFVIDQRPYRAALDQAKASQVSAEAKVTFAQTDYERAQSLSRTGNISEQVTDQRRQSLQTAQADVDSARAAVQQAQLNLEFTEVKAPVAGRISQRQVSVGNVVVADQTLLTTIVSLDPIYFSFPVDERSFLAYQSRLKIGLGATQGEQSVPVAVALAGEKHPTRKGKLGFVDNRVDEATGTVLLRATIENPDGTIKPGLFGVVSLPASPRYRAVLIPDEAIAANQDKRLVWVIAEDGTASSREIRPGPKIDGYRVVRDGLKGDEWIVTAGLTRVKAGAKVTPERKTLPETRD